MIDLNQAGQQRGTQPAVRFDQGLAERILAEEADNVATAPEGSRNDQLNRSAFALGQLVAGGVFSESRVVDALERAADDAGLAPCDARSTIRSGLKDGKMDPRTLKDHDGAARTPEEKEADRVAQEKRKAEGKAKVREDQARAKSITKAILAALAPADSNPYLTRKKAGAGYGLGSISHAGASKILQEHIPGFNPDKGKFGELKGDLLAVLCFRDFAQEPDTLELIDGAGTKYALLGGGRGIYGTAPFPAPGTPGLTFYVGEGVATCLSASQAMQDGIGVAAFSNGQLEKTARALRDRYPDARIVLLADLLKTTGEPDPKAVNASRAVGVGMVVPDFGPGWTAAMGTDFNDLARERGPEAVRECIEVALAADQAEEVNLDDGSDLKPTEFTLDGFLGVGVLYVAGAHGVGKSSLLVPLVAVITGELEGSGVGAFLKRKVLYFAEDPDQILRVRYGLEKHCGLRRNGNFILRQTRRMSDAHLRALVASLVKEHTISGPNSYPVKPLIVFDTLSASFELQDENSNSEAAKFIAAIKESGGSTPVWLIGHIAKALLRADVESMCGRGAGAWEADSQGTAFIFSEPDGAQDLRYLRTRKRRFEADFLEVRFATSLDQEVRQAPWGEVQTVRIRYGIPERSDEETRKQDVQDVQTIKQAGQDARARELILDFLQGEYAPVSKNDIEQYTTEQRSPRESARRALLEMVRVGEVEMVEKYLAKDGKARKNGYQLRDKFASEV